MNRETGARKSIRAAPTSKRDTYRATVRFDSRGTWSYEIAYGDAGTRLADSISIGATGSSGSGSGWKLLALGAAAIALAALVALVLSRRGRRRADPVAPRRAQPSSELADDRRSLITFCVYLFDVVGDEALRGRLREALAGAGVSELDSVGARFDPSRHRATGRVPTDDPALDGRIAEVERRGFSDRGEILRLPEVLVYSTGNERKR